MGIASCHERKDRPKLLELHPSEEGSGPLLSFKTSLNSQIGMTGLATIEKQGLI
jgi:hypothetical protein